MSIAILCGLVGFVFIELLCQPFEVFGWWPETLRRVLFKTDALVDYEDMSWWQLLLYKPFAACGKCFAGWFSLAYFLTNMSFNPFSLAMFVSLAIFMAWVLEQLKIQIEQ
jgi:hypothetical protein